MASWTLDVYDRIGATLVKSNVGFEALEARWVLNAPGSLECDVNLYADLGGAAVGRNELQLKRNGTCVWAGPWLGTDVDDPRSKKLKISAEGLWSWFRSRVVTSDLLYTAINQQQIAWNLLNHTQGQTFGSLGIVQGAHTGGNIARTRYYCAGARPNIADEVEHFTEFDDGLDFEINPATRAFNTWQPSRKADSGITLDGTKVDSIRYTEDVRTMETFVTAIGSDDCGPITIDVSDSTLANLYGRRHAVVQPDEVTTLEITGVANEELRANKEPRFDATVIFRENGTGAPAWSDLVVGNTLKLTDDRGYATYTNRVLRITEVAVHLDNGLPNNPVIELALTSAVD